MPLNSLTNSVPASFITLMDNSSIMNSIKQYPQRNISYFKYKSEGLQLISDKKLDSLEGNAFEHSYMSAQLSIEYNVGTADFLGWSQEIVLFLVRDVPKYVLDKNSTKLGNQMRESMGDIHNNEIGHKVGELVMSGVLKRSQIADVLVGAIKTNQLIVDKINDPRISKSEYQDPDFNLSKAMNYSGTN